jgi:transmembrane sensor
MNQNRIKYLLKSYDDNISTQEEVEELFSQMKSAESDEQLKNLIIESTSSVEPTIDLSPDNWVQVWNNIRSGALKPAKKTMPAILFSGYAAAAFLALVVGLGILFIEHKKKGGTHVIVSGSVNKNDIRPGSNKALLTLADGSSIVLDSAKNGYLTNQNNTKIIKLNSGLLSYKKTGKNDGKVLYNTIATPRGGQYQLELPDGTSVWLNAASSLVFPTVFAGKERRVELKGEAYFEVAKNASMPFHVTVNKMDVKVLGTHFNIMSYADEENISITLLEGRVDLTANGVKKKLQPGRQAVVNKKTNIIEVGSANIKQVMNSKT